MRYQRMKAILQEVFEQPGYSNAITISDEDLGGLREAISRQWLGAIRNAHPQLADTFKACGIARYHEFAHLVDHSRLWNKSKRCLPAKRVQAIKRMNFMAELAQVFGPFSLAKVSYENGVVEDREEIYWRLVRPGQASDVGPLHADKWFHEMLGLQGSAISQGSYTLKVWIPIHCEPGKNGLLLVPNSHKRDWKHSTALVNGVPKPVFEDEAEAILLPTPPGNLLVFREETLHGGAVNKSDETRVSCEITLVFNDHPANRNVVVA
jgi:hypothetical protein